jgi:hypothetical protein
MVSPNRNLGTEVSICLRVLGLREGTLPKNVSYLGQICIPIHRVQSRYSPVLVCNVNDSNKCLHRGEEWQDLSFE